MADFATEMALLSKMTVKRLRLRYEEVFGEPTAVGNKPWLVKRIAWRIQALEHGGLSERAKERAKELANDADLRLNPPRELLAEAEAKANAKPVPTTKPAPTPTQPVPQPTAERTKVVQTPTLAWDDRLPPAGTILVRKYKGKTLQVKVLVNGFEHEGNVYPSLSACAKAITGSHCNGFAFFNLNKESA